MVITFTAASLALSIPPAPPCLPLLLKDPVDASYGPSSSSFSNSPACPRPGGAVEAGSYRPGSFLRGDMRTNEALRAKAGPGRRCSGLDDLYGKPRRLIARA